MESFDKQNAIRTEQSAQWNVNPTPSVYTMLGKTPHISGGGEDKKEMDADTKQQVLNETCKALRDGNDTDDADTKQQVVNEKHEASRDRSETDDADTKQQVVNGKLGASKDGNETGGTDTKQQVVNEKQEAPKDVNETHGAIAQDIVLDMKNKETPQRRVSRFRRFLNMVTACFRRRRQR
ncbi:uncharacterized protein LOC106171974 [Lingula anatina]|uniref:Uncharacterized protein LOC106171974 n=1 Tax=Lingula anatina TaxID=7574 RepID=A0A1S3JC31_LINAN|nr:uncharacterized protein LOC106171974 [Lingula anatina]|eukprot:XP_013407965.1 uncharacterized protein LOC106171974 [Lingula anatina]